MRENLLKKNMFTIKDGDKKLNATFLSLSHYNIVHDFRGKCRVITNSPTNLSHVKNLLRVKDVFETDNEISEFLLKLFEMLEYL